MASRADRASRASVSWRSASALNAAGGLFGRSHVGAQAVERGDRGVKLAQRVGGRLLEFESACGLLRPLERERIHAFGEFACGLFEPRDFGDQRRGALDQAGVCRLGLGHVRGQPLDAIARVAQPLLGGREPLVRAHLPGFDLRDRLTRLGLSRLEPGDFVLGPSALGRQHLALAIQAHPFLPRAAQLRVEGDHGLFVLMQPGGRAFDCLLCLAGHRRGRCHAKCQVRQRVALGLHAGTHFLDLALGGQNPPSILATAADHHVPAPRQLAVERRDIQAGGARGAHGRVPRLGDIPAGDHRTQELGVGAADADQVGHRDHTLRGRPGRCRGHLAEHHEAAATGLLLAQQLHTGGRMLVGRHDDVLQQVAEQRLDRAFVPAIHFEVIGHRAALFHAPVGLRQQHAGRLGEPRAGRFEFLERSQASRQPGQIVLAGAQLLRQRGVLGTCRRQPRLERHAFNAGVLQGTLHVQKRPARRPA